MELSEVTTSNNKEVSKELADIIRKNYKKKDIKFFKEQATKSDKENAGLIAEQQTNILIYASEHYAKVADNFRRVLMRNQRYSESDPTVIKLTMNHMHSICNEYINNILTYSPTTRCRAIHEEIAQQEKDAKLSNSVLKHILKQNDEVLLINDLASDYTIIGEAARYMFFDPSKGSIIGYEPKPETVGLFRQELDEFGNVVSEVPIEPEPDLTKPIRSGEVIIEIINPCDIFLESGIEKLSQSRFIGIKRLRDRQYLINKIVSNPALTDEQKLEKVNWLNNGNKESYSIYERNGRLREDNEDMFLVRYFFYKPNDEFPKGRIFETIDSGIISETDLQEDENGEAFFPIDIIPCVSINGSPRGVSIIRQGRVLQAEINRTMSKTAEHQILLGDDKIITSGKDGLTEGSKIGGVRQLSLEKGYQGFQVIQGRSGEQFVPYLQLLINQLYYMYKLESKDTDSNNKNNADISVVLLRNMSQKKVFIKFAKKFEKFLCKMSTDAISLAKRYYDEKTIINMIGSNEAVNVSEFKKVNDMSYAVEIEPINGDAETQMANFMAFKEIMQYMGKNIDKKTLGNILSNMPFIPNAKSIMASLMVHENRAKDISLALDRGQYPNVQKYENQDVILQHLSERMCKADYYVLIQNNPVVDQNYKRQIQEREQIKSQQLDAIRKANQGEIPTEGDLVNINIWQTVPTADGKGVKTTTMKMPYSTVEWAYQLYQKAIQSKEVMDMLPPEMQAEIAQGGKMQVDNNMQPVIKNNNQQQEVGL